MPRADDGAASGHGVGRLLRRFAQIEGRSLDFERGFGVTDRQFSVLAAIVSDPGRDQRSVVDATSVDRSTVAKVVRQLVDRGLVGASRHPADSRRGHLVPTPSAIELVYEATPELLRRHDAILAGLPSGSREAFLQALQVVAYAGLAEPPARYRVPSPGEGLPAVEVHWGLGRMVRAAVQRHNRLWVARVRAVTPAQWLALTALAAEGALDQRSLGTAIDLDKASLTELLARIRSRGWVSKTSDVRDARRRILTLTPLGTALIDELASAAAQVDERFVDPLDAGRRDALIRGLGAFIGGGGTIG